MKGITADERAAAQLFRIHFMECLRSLCLNEARKTLHGFLITVGDDADVDDLRDLYASMTRCEEQLDLIKK